MGIALQAIADNTQAQPIYHKGSGLASLAKFLASAQHLHSTESSQRSPQKASDGDIQKPVAGQQTTAAAAADSSRPASATK